jgi:glycosyltransferase involved in cell wall biosynthesis
VPEFSSKGNLPISVLITAYNRREYLAQAVASALNQSLSEELYEIILTKNFDSSDDENWRATGVKLIRFDGGALGERVAHALRFCRGEMVAFLDDDDWWAPTKLERVYSAWKKQPRAVYFYNKRVDVDLDGRPLPQKVTGDWKRYGWNSSSAVIRRSILEENIEHLKRLGMSTDTFSFFAAFASGFPMVYIGEPLTFYRVPPSGPFKPERKDVNWADLGVILEVSEGSTGCLVRFNEMVVLQGVYSSLVRRIRASRRPRLREVARFMSLSLAFGTGFRRCVLVAVGLVSPPLFRRLNPEAYYTSGYTV